MVAFERTLIIFGVAVEVRGKNPFLIEASESRAVQCVFLLANFRLSFGVKFCSCPSHFSVQNLSYHATFQYLGAHK